MIGLCISLFFNFHPDILDYYKMKNKLKNIEILILTSYTTSVPVVNDFYHKLKSINLFMFSNHQPSNNS